MWPLDNYSLLVTILILLLHLVLLLLAVLLGRRKKRPLSVGEILFCAAVPLFGPVCGMELIYAEEPDPELLRDRVMNPDPMRKSYTAPDPEAPSTAPMEEAFLISEPAVRREMMMKLLHDDPEKNVELLMIARFNDDPETAHYATATLTEYQRQTEMSLQQSQALLAKDPGSTADRLAYIHQMETYIASGLLEGHLLLRQRTLLEQEIAKVSGRFSNRRSRRSPRRTRIWPSDACAAGTFWPLVRQGRHRKRRGKQPPPREPIPRRT